MKIDDVNTEKVKVLSHQRPADAKAKSVMNLEVTVDTTPQQLSRKLKDFGGMAISIPPFIAPEAQIVLQALFACFEKQKEIKEGKFVDWVWGFARGGIPPQCSMSGIKHLIKLKYLTPIAPDNTEVMDITNEKQLDCMLRYEKKLLDMVYEGSVNETKIQDETKKILTDIGFNQEIK